jgi:hypothetical protein
VALVSGERIVHFDDIGFTVLARAAGASCDLACYKQTSADATGEPGDPRWYGEGDDTFHTEDAPLVWGDARVKPWLSGDVKWDGCSNWGFYADPVGVMLHFCGRSQAVALGALLDRCYLLALEVLGTWVHDRALFEGSGPRIKVEVTT